MKSYKKCFNLIWAIPASLLLALALILFLPRAAADSPGFGRGLADDGSDSLLPASPGLRIAVASDLHLDPDNTDKTNAASETVYNLEIVDAMLWDAKRQGAEILLLTGDLVNGGREHKHAALAEKLHRAEEDGLRVYVLPGNHDLYPVNQTTFTAYYADFGYNDAFSRDPSSLSYCVIVDDLMLLMMDTAGYDPHAIDLSSGLANAGSMGLLNQGAQDLAFLSASTLSWARSMLEEARDRHLFVLCAGHYNLLPPISRQSGSGYYVRNGEQMTALLQEFQVPLYLSGHMHTRAVYQDGGLTELLTECLTAYPVAYSILDLTDRELVYTPCELDVRAWAWQTGQRDERLLRFPDWQREQRLAGCRHTVSLLAEKQSVSQEDADLASEFFYAFLEAYSHGTLAGEAEQLRQSAGYAPFMVCAQNSNYGPWIQDLLEHASPMRTGFTLELG